MDTTIGIPKSMLYYHYHKLWEVFFKQLGCKIIYSPETNKQIIERGKKLIVDESCLSIKIHMGHVDYLSGKCDYILIPHIECLERNEKLCTNFFAIYDLAANLFPDKILDYYIDKKKKNNEKAAFLKMGATLGFDQDEVIKAYKKAKAKQLALEKFEIEENKAKLEDNKKIKVLLVGHLYNIYDELVGKPIIKYLTKNNVEIIYAHLNDNEPKAYKEISKTLYWTFNKNYVNGLVMYEKEVDGIIMLTTFPCGPDSLVNELCLRKISKPAIQLIIDELNSATGLETRLESFVDILERSKK